MSTRTGSCLCGSVKILIQGTPVSTNLCHCTSCQKFSGAAYASLAAFKTSEVTYSESEPSIMKTYDDTSSESGRIVKRKFCGRCGSSVCGMREGLEEFTIVPIGILDGDKSDLKPAVEFFYKSKINWIPTLPGTQCFETLPSTS
ncbi:glutathione-dependent formaldehyde-activating, GFA [Xylaria curta]|nr:glutathione-dependent formaldehyde-activating, GFA [Xylaria curta]